MNSGTGIFLGGGTRINQRPHRRRIGQQQYSSLITKMVPEIV